MPTKIASTTNTIATSDPVQLIWATPDGDNLLGYMARVSNPKATPEDDASKLIAYLIRHRHWSPFEMINACVKITSSRDIIRQLLRHKSLFFQEFSGRYSEYEDTPCISEARTQDTKNRQNSFASTDSKLSQWWSDTQLHIWDVCFKAYQAALRLGIAKELARKLLPEGLVPTTIYVNGTLRSWIHYWDVRCTPETQKEHRLVAEATRDVVLQSFPGIAKTLAMAQEHPDPAISSLGSKGE